MSVGALVVSLQAEIAQFTSAMDKASAIAEQRMKQIDKTVGVVKTSLAALGAGAAAGLTLDAVKGKIESAIQSAAGLQELSERTGTTVERISGLAAVSKIAGGDNDALATSLQKLSKTMLDAEDGGKKSASAFNSIGISVKDLKGLKPDEVYELIARSQQKWADGGEKNAAMQQLLGKAGANQLPVMKALAEVGDLQVKVTAEQARQAQEYERNLRRLDGAQNAIFKTIGLALVPVMNSFTMAMLESATKADGVKGSVDALAKDDSIVTWAKNAATALGFVVDAFDGVGRTTNIVGKTIGRLAAVGVAKATGESRSVIEAIKTDYEADMNRILGGTLFSDRLAAQLAKIKPPKDFVGPPAPGLPTPNYHPNADNASKDDPAKAFMEGQIKAGDALIAAEKKQLATREAYLASFYQQQYFSASEYYDTQKQLIADELKNELATYDKELAAARAFLSHSEAQGDKVKAQEARNKIAEVTAKRTAAETDANERLTKVTLDAAKAYRDFDLATTAVAYAYGLENAQAQFSFAMMGKSTLAVQQLTATRKIDLDLQQRIHEMEVKGYSQAELTVQIAKATVDAEAQKAIVIDNVTKSYNKQRDAMFGAQEALRKYVEDATNMGAQVENTVSSSFKGMEDALVNFATTGKLSFSSLVNSIIADMARMAVQQSITGPLASWALGLFGGGGGNPGGGFSSDASLLSYIDGKRADGGPVSSGSSYLVGERGPEIFTPTSGGRIIPNGQLGAGGGGGPTIIINATIGSVASQTDVIQGMQSVRRQIMGELSRSRSYAGAAQ
jgi:lambda family phage tail tape measure protein